MGSPDIDSRDRTDYHQISVLLYQESEIADPLSEVISLLQPQAPFSKLAEASGPFRVRRDDLQQAFYSLLLAGRVRLETDGQPPLDLHAGDFVFLPAVTSFTVSSLDPPPPPGMRSWPVQGPDGVFRLGPPDAAPQVQQLVGHCTFAGPDAGLLIPLLPDVTVVRGEDRLSTLAGLLRDEARANRPARDVVVEHLLQVLLIETFRSGTTTGATRGLLRGLDDPRIAPALRAIHDAPGRDWTITDLASVAGLSRSAFFTRFSRIVGGSPMRYLKDWRMTLARHMLRSGKHDKAEISERIGYGSASAFSTAFTRHVGLSPSRYAKQAIAAE